MYYYKIYNLITQSEFSIPAAYAIEKPETVDVTIKFGDMDIDIKELKNTFFFSEEYYFCYVDPDNLYIHVAGFGFSVKNGSLITVSSPKNKYELHLLHTFTLGSAFGGLCIQRGLLPIHGTTIEYNSKATILTGFSGAGKSAISEGLIGKGMRFLADDVSVLSFENGIAVIHPAYPQRKLPADTATQIGLDSSNLELIREDNRDKYLIKNPEQWCDKPLPLDKVVELVALRRKDNEYFMPILSPVTGIESMYLLRRNLYREKFYSLCGFPPERMKLLLQATSASSTYRLARCADNCPVNQCVDVLLKELFSY